MATYISTALVLGQVTSERFAAVKVPASLRPHVDALNELFTSFKKAEERAQAARVAHAEATRHTQGAHDALRAGIEELAAAIVRDDPSLRMQPFAPFGSSPSNLLRTTRAGAAKAALGFAQRVLATSPKKLVRDAADACIKHARALDQAHTKLTPIAVSWKRAREERDALLADFTQQYGSVKRLAKHVWRKTPADYEAVFAPVERFRMTRSRKKHNANGAADSPNPAQPGAQPGAPPALVGSGHVGPAIEAPATHPTPPVNAPALNGASTHLVS